MVILLVLAGALLVFGAVRLRAAIAAFDMLIIKFTGVNQQFYENQKIITQRASDILKMMANETATNKNMVADLRRMAQEQIKCAADTYTMVQKLSADIKPHGVDTKKIMQTLAAQKDKK